MIAIKTDKEVGKLIHVNVRLIDPMELQNLEIGDFELIYSHECDDNSMKLAQVIILNKLMKHDFTKNT